MTGRDKVLAALPAASGGPLPEATGKQLSSSELWSRFEERFAAQGGRIGTLDDVLSLVGRIHLDEDAGLTLEAYCRSHRREPPPFLKDQAGEGGIWDAEVGITLAEAAVAETGSLLIASSAGRRRLASLAPPHHIALVKKDNLVSTLDEALGLLGRGPAAYVLISGPSRTADIEGVIVLGAHGPAQLTVVVL
jgi:hypothetical protein